VIEMLKEKNDNSGEILWHPLWGILCHKPKFWRAGKSRLLTV